MKTEIKREEFIPFILTIQVESHKEFKDLYGDVHGKITLENLISKLSDYSNENKISV